MSKRFTTRKVVTLGILAAISIILVYFIRFPLFPAVPFLEYDPADIPILLGTLMLGPIEGLVLTLVVSVIQGLTVSSSSGPIGILMHFFATGGFVLVTGLIYKRKKTIKNAIVSLSFGVATMTITMVIWNLVFTPIFLGTPIDAVISLLPFIILFNLLKAGINAFMALILQRSIIKLNAHLL